MTDTTVTPQKEEKDLGIVWKNEYEGYESNHHYSGPVLSRIQAIAYAILDRVIVICRTTATKRDPFYIPLPPKILSLARPLFRKSEIDSFMRFMEQVAISCVKKIEMDEKDQSDLAFQARVSAKRDWKACCSICLQHVGTTCDCGHTEIVMFRPCGHTICARPCFQDLFSHLTGQKLKPKTKKIGDQIIPFGTELNVNTTGGFTCPLCRVEVTRTFRAEETNADHLEARIAARYFLQYIEKKK